MANVNAPFGLKPVRYASGAPYNGAANPYFATGASGAIFLGDPVVMTGTANTSEFGGYPAGTLATVGPATAGDGNPVLGVCVAVLPVTRESVIYREDSTDRVIMVADDPELVFHGQTDAAGTDWAATDVGSFANLLTGAGSTVNGLSGFTLDTTDGPANNDPSNQLFIRGLANLPENVIGDYSIWEVMINNHQLANVGDAGRFTAV